MNNLLNISFIFLIAVASTGCNQSSTTSQKPIRKSNGNIEKPSSQSLKPLFIGDLTTGIIFEKKELSKQIKFPGGSVMYMNYFGEDRVLMIESTKDKTIYSFDVTIGGSLSEIKKALENKISEENGKKIVFECQERKYKAGLSWVENKCLITSGPHQKLLLEERFPESSKPSGMDINTRELMHTSSVKLSDMSIKNREDYQSLSQKKDKK